MDEQLVCIPADWCDKRFLPGVTSRSDLDATILDDAPRLIVPRPEAETRDDIVQLVGYSIVRYEDRVLYYARGKAGGEGNLHARLSVGIGGHVEQDDLCDSGVPGAITWSITKAAYRELREELVIASNVALFSFRGFIRNVDDAVGKRHLGLLYEARLDGRQVQSREPEKIVFPTFSTLPNLWSTHIDRMERWSQLAIDHLLVYGHKEA